MGWYKEYLQDLEDIAREKATAKGCGCLLLLVILIGGPLCAGLYIKDHFFEYSEDEKIVYALGMYIGDSEQIPMQRVLSSFKKKTGNDTLAMKYFGEGFGHGFRNYEYHYRGLERDNAYDYYQKKGKRKRKSSHDEIHNQVFSYEYGYCYGRVVNEVLKENFAQESDWNLKKLMDGAGDYYPWIDPIKHEARYPQDSVHAILGRNEEFVAKFTNGIRDKCGLF